MTRRGLIAVGAALLVLLAVAGVRQARLARLSAPELGADGRPVVRFLRKPAQIEPFSVQDLNGRPVSLEALKGKVTLVNFWATWCPPCRAEIPDLIRLQDKYRAQFQVLAVSQDDDPAEKVKEFAKTWGFNYPVAMTTASLERSFPGVFALPTSFVLDRDGQLVQKHMGQIKVEVLEAEIRTLAGLDRATVEYVDDPDEARLVDAAQANKIPGIDLKDLPAERRSALLQELNTTKCTCGCGLTVAQCRINDPGCEISLPLAKKILEDFKKK